VIYWLAFGLILFWIVTLALFVYGWVQFVARNDGQEE
jgi:hypothetical protein